MKKALEEDYQLEKTQQKIQLNKKPTYKKPVFIYSIITLLVIALVVITVSKIGDSNNESDRHSWNNNPDTESLSAVEVGKQLSNNNCTGKEPGVLSKPAMDASDFNMIIPYGLMVGGHVTPIDHQYYSPVDYRSARDAYPVYAMGDAALVSIEHRTNSPGDNQHVIDNPTDEYRLVFSQSCTFFTITT